MGRFGFDANLIAQKISTLSGGQRSRVAFALLTWQVPHCQSHTQGRTCMHAMSGGMRCVGVPIAHTLCWCPPYVLVIIMDEPTNHLDLDVRHQTRTHFTRTQYTPSSPRLVCIGRRLSVRYRLSIPSSMVSALTAVLFPPSRIMLNVSSIKLRTTRSLSISVSR
jgi:ABC-type glutathione transport system ATPase component